MRQMGIRTFRHMELEACWDELDWLIRYHNSAAYNCPEEKYSPRPPPFPSHYFDNLNSRLGKVKKGILPPTLKTILKTYYHLPEYQVPVHPQQQGIPSCPQEEHLETSLELQPDDMMGTRNGEHNPLERPQASEGEDKVVADGTLHVDQGGHLFFKPW